MSDEQRSELGAEFDRLRQHIDQKLDSVANALVQLRAAVHDEVDAAFLQSRAQAKQDLEAASRLILGAVDGATAELSDLVRSTAAGLDRKLDAAATRIEGKTDALAEIVASHREVMVENASRVERILRATNGTDEAGNGNGADDFDAEERPTLTE